MSHEIASHDATWSVGDVVALLALVLSLLSLGWQVVSHRLSGARVKVDVGTFIRMSSGDEPSEGASITVRNVGRMVAVVSHLAIEMNAGDNMRVPLAPIVGLEGPHVPERVEAGDSAQWLVPLPALQEIKQRYPDSSRWKAAVSLASGKEVKSKNGFGRIRSGEDR